VTCTGHIAECNWEAWRKETRWHNVRCEENLKFNFKGVRCGGVDRIHLTQCRFHWQALVELVMNCGLQNNLQFEWLIASEEGLWTMYLVSDILIYALTWFIYLFLFFHSVFLYMNSRQDVGGTSELTSERLNIHMPECPQHLYIILNLPACYQKPKN